MRSPRLLSALLVGLFLASSIPNAASASSPPAPSSEELRERGRRLVILGSVMQSIGVGLGVADTLGGGFLAAPRSFYSLATIPFAPLTIHGFDLWLSDGTEVGQLRAQAGGYFEAAGYSGLVALFSSTALLVRGRACAEAEAASGYPVCSEDVGGVFQVLNIIPHALTAGAMLFPAFILTGVAAHKESRGIGGASYLHARTAPRLAFAPMFRPEGGGLQVVGVF